MFIFSAVHNRERLLTDLLPNDVTISFRDSLDDGKI